ncbi:hypothetical protein EDC04DRAFT_2610407 [Pisolithus marmoratus]|nr:hypothetical protein EDC04DRAFT_2610407 [Pisolithus marmoratus]
MLGQASCNTGRDISSRNLSALITLITNLELNTEDAETLATYLALARSQPTYPTTPPYLLSPVASGLPSREECPPPAPSPTSTPVFADFSAPPVSIHLTPPDPSDPVTILVCGNPECEATVPSLADDCPLKARGLQGWSLCGSNGKLCGQGRPSRFNPTIHSTVPPFRHSFSSLHARITQAEPRLPNLAGSTPFKHVNSAHQSFTVTSRTLGASLYQMSLGAFRGGLGIDPMVNCADISEGQPMHHGTPSARSGTALALTEFAVSGTSFKHSVRYILHCSRIPSSQNAPASKRASKCGDAASVGSDDGGNILQQSTMGVTSNKPKPRRSVQPPEGWEEHMFGLRDRRRSLTPRASTTNTPVLPSPSQHHEGQVYDEDAEMEEVEEDSNDNVDEPRSSSEQDEPKSSSEQDEEKTSAEEDDRSSNYNESEDSSSNYDVSGDQSSLPPSSPPADQSDDSDPDVEETVARRIPDFKIRVKVGL